MDDLKKFEEQLKEVDFGNVALGATGATTSHILLNIPLEAAGLLHAWEWKDAEGRWIWGIGTGNVLNIIAGAGLLLGGVAMEKEDAKTAKQLREAGLGWLLTMGVIKVGEIAGPLYRWWQETSKLVGARGTRPQTESSPPRKPPGRVIKL